MTALFALAMVCIAIVTVAGVVGYMVAASLAQMSEVAQRAVTSLAQVKGLPPHAASPETFAPGGRSWEAVEKERVEVTSSSVAAARERRKMELRDAIRVLELRGEGERVIGLQQQLKEMEKAG